MSAEGRAFFSYNDIEHVMLLSSMKRSVSIIGAGRVGRTLGKCLHDLGWRIGAVVTRSKATAREAVRAIGDGTPYSAITPDVLGAGIILLTTPDDLLASAAVGLARTANRESCRGKIILHTSGGLDCGVLRPLTRLGAATGSLHPMQTFSGRNIPKLKGTIFAVEGDPRARRVARAIARSLGGTPIDIDGETSPLITPRPFLWQGTLSPWPRPPRRS